MKKVALCLSGYFGSLKDLSSRGEDGYEYIHKHILDHPDADVDVFFHNWEPEREQQLIELYNPVIWNCEDQIDFVKVAEEHGVSRKDLDPLSQLGTWTVDSKTGSGYVGPERILSQLYSVQQSFEFMEDYEQEAGFKYDCVIKSRFDLGRINRNTTGPGKKNPHPCQCIDFDPNRDMDKFYMAFWDLFNEGPPDMWFYSSSENMGAFARVFDNALSEYLPLGSEYSKAVTQGWFESRANEFRTNEMFLAEPTENLHKYPPHMVVNAILLYKWFLKDSGLWDKAVALKTAWE